MLVFRPDRTLRGGDQLPFVEAGIPAVRFTASGEDYSRQHQDVRVESGVAYGDTPEHIDAAYLAGVARLNAAVLVHLADGPQSPPDTRLVAELSSDTLLRWSPSHDADVAGYEVVWRATTSPSWEHVLDVGRATEARLPVSKDDSFFGVRARDTSGYSSPVSPARPVFPGAPPPAAAPPPMSAPQAQVPATDACRPAGGPPRNAPASLVFVGEFVGAKDDSESGYAHALRSYRFKPLRSWRGVASADETGGVMFVPGASDPAPHKTLPHFTRGQAVFVVVDLGGMSGLMAVVSEAIPVDAARARIMALGAPCWTR